MPAELRALLRSTSTSRRKKRPRQKLVDVIADNIVIARVLGIPFNVFPIYLDGISPEFYSVILEALAQKRGTGKKKMTLAEMLLMSR